MKKFCALIFGIVLFTGLAKAVSVTVTPPPTLQFLDVNGHPLAGGAICTYAGGTTTPLATYVDSTGTTQNAVCTNTGPTVGSPGIVLNSGGYTGTGGNSIWLIPNTVYKFVAYNSLGVQQWTVDNIAGTSNAAAGACAPNATCTVSGAWNFTGGLQVSGVAVAGTAYRCDLFTGATAGQKIQACLQAASTAGGAVADATQFTGAQNFDVDIFAGVTNPVKLIMGSMTVLVQAAWIIPGGSDVAGVGNTTVMQFATPPGWISSTTYHQGSQIKGTSSGSNPILEEEQNATCISNSGPQPTWNENLTPVSDGTCSWVAKDLTNLRFINGGLHPWDYATAGAGETVNVGLHDMLIDGQSQTNWTCVGFRALKNGSIYNLTIQNCNGSTTSNGIDLRDTQNIDVHDNIILASGIGSGHALGGGTNAAIASCSFCGRFQENKIDHNYVNGGSGDGIDISGINGASAVCDNNKVSDNVVDSTGTQGIFNETCGHTVIANNIVNSSGKAGIYVNTGTGGQNSNGLAVTGNVVNSPGHDSVTNGGGIVCAGSSNNTFTANTINSAQDHGINLENCALGLISGNLINSVGLNANSTYDGIFINSTASGNSIQNSITGNSIKGGASAMLYPIEYRSSNPGNSNNNMSANNVANGGTAGNAGGVSTTPVQCDTNSHNNYSNFDQYSNASNSVQVPSVQHCT